MQGTFRLMNGGAHIGTFEIDSEKDRWLYKQEAENSAQPLVFRLSLADQSAAVLSGEVVRDWLTGRAPEADREFIDALMEKVGIREYDPLAFVAYNSGRFNTDSFYLTE